MVTILAQINTIFKIKKSHGVYSIVIMRTTTQNDLFHALWLIYWCCTDTILLAAAEAIYISYRESLNTTYLVSAIETFFCCLETFQKQG